MAIQDYGFIEGGNDALNLSVVCKSINAEARQHANINLKKCERKITTLLTQLKGIEHLAEHQYMER
ncbi:hypothetical protein [Candidatus Mesenet endosymbiont of Phosphuga atrata]|uniref:hypothetical protein n=1 Tax=Candidatus Mesenet endosymbiont of Phosphuga atrata TaxID=3066221 RepID=UPI0030CC5EE4